MSGMNGKKIGIIVLGSLGLFTLAASLGGSPPEDKPATQASVVSKTPETTCTKSSLKANQRNENTDKLPKGKSVVVETGSNGEEEVCKQGDKEVSRKVTTKAIDAVTLAGTASLPTEYDGKYDTQAIKDDYGDGKLDKNHFGVFTEPKKKVPAQAQTKSQSKPKPAPTKPQQASVYYKNCTAVRAAGAAPIYEGQLGYRAALDRDKDGIACE